MNRKLALIAIAHASGLDYDQAVALVEVMLAGLPDDDVEAGRAVAEAADPEDLTIG